MPARDQRLYFQLQRTAHRLQKIADRELLDAAGVTTAQAAVLVVLESARDATQRDVARVLGINESTMTALAGRLENLGLIERTRSPDDPRAWRLLVTEAGSTAARRAGAAFESINAMIDASLGDDGSIAMARGLEAIWRASSDR